MADTTAHPRRRPPRVSAGQRRTLQFSFLIAPEERALIAEAAAEAGMRLAAYARARALTMPVSNRVLTYGLARLTAEVSRIGNNLNQLARWANATGGSLPELAILEEIRAELKQAVADLRAEIAIERPRRRPSK